MQIHTMYLIVTGCLVQICDRCNNSHALLQSSWHATAPQSHSAIHQDFSLAEEVKGAPLPYEICGVLGWTRDNPLCISVSLVLLGVWTRSDNNHVHLPLPDPIITHPRATQSTSWFSDPTAGKVHPTQRSKVVG